ncbi:MAG: GAF domain-containing protein [Deltaproteobacteria bacterium]|nr:GAF domain-containing protein [Deltaproteobacteria bacterium]
MGFLKKVFATAARLTCHRYEYMDLWLETTEKISSRLDTAEIKSLLAEICGRWAGASPVHVWLFDAASRSYTANSLNIEPGLRRIRTEHQLVELIKEASGLPFFLKGALTPKEFNRLAAPLNAQVCVPLIAHREITGFLLAGKQGRAAYSESDLRVLGAIAAQAAIQVKNIRLSGELLDMRESDQFNRMSSFVAHDLKNLTNSLALLGHNARGNIGDPAFQREALKAIDATVVKMRSVVDKMAGGLRSLEVNPGWCDIRAVFARASRRLPSGAYAKLRVDEGHSLPCMIDEELVETVFLNILTNASEATADGEQIRVSFHKERAALAVVISDNGSGIPMPFLENGLFRPFRTTKKDGFGVGLYQCKTVMEAHGGTIEVESEEGKGATFTLKFPVTFEYAEGKAC